MSTLPAGWAVCDVDELIDDIEAGLNVRCIEQPPEGDASGLVKISAVTWGKFDELQSKTLMPNAAIRESNRIRPGDLLISRANTLELVGACVLVGAVSRHLYLSDKVLRLRVPEVYKRWLMYALRSNIGRHQIEGLASGNQLSMRNLSQLALRSIQLPLAPLSEQKRIVDKLDAILARVDACRDRLDRVPALLKRFRQAVLAAATSGKLTEDWRADQVARMQPQAESGYVVRDAAELRYHVTPTPDSAALHPGYGLNTSEEGVQTVLLGEDEMSVPQTWTVLALREVIDPARPLCYGVVQPGEERTGGVPLIRVQDMDRSEVMAHALRTVAPDVDAEYKRSRVVGGDLLISVVGTIGRTAIVPDGLKANIARAIARVACRSEISSMWVNIWLSTDTLQWWLISTSKEVARKTLNLSDLATTKVAIPSIDEQTEIIRRVETLFAYADRLEARYKTARAQVEKLTPALLAKAFRGELVPQDPDDEPAETLLARLRAQQAERPDAGRRGRHTMKAG